MVRFLFLRGLLKSINSSPSGFLLRALALGRETLRMTVRTGLRRLVLRLAAVARRAAERFTKRPLLLRALRVRRRVDREVFVRGLINRTRLNSGMFCSL